MVQPDGLCSSCACYAWSEETQAGHEADVHLRGHMSHSQRFALPGQVQQERANLKLSPLEIKAGLLQARSVKVSPSKSLLHTWAPSFMQHAAHPSEATDTPGRVVSSPTPGWHQHPSMRYRLGSSLP